MSEKKNKRSVPNRGKAFKRLRESGFGGLDVMTFKNGSESIINPTKHFLLQKPYKNDELAKEMLRRISLWMQETMKPQSAESQVVTN